MALTQAQKDAARAKLQKNVSRETEEQYLDSVTSTPEPMPSREELQAEYESQESPESRRNGYGAADVEPENVRDEQAIAQRAAVLAANDYSDVDDISWNGDMGLAVTHDPEPLTLVEGFTITPGMNPEEIEVLYDIVQSYTGVIPRKIDSYCNQWLTMIGCVLMPIKDERIDEETGELVTLEWTAPLFKLANRDDITGFNIILTGGGKYGKQFAKAMTLIHGPGDWKKPKQVFISQESRPKGDGEPDHRMYRFNSRKVQK